MLIALIAKTLGYDGTFSFANIGMKYPSNVPYVGIRTALALFGISAISALTAAMIEAGLNLLCVATAASLMVFDGALTTHVRFILLDSMTLAFSAYSFYFWVKFRQQRNKPFSISWWTYLSITGFFIGCASSVKMVGFFTVATIGVATISDLWDLADLKRNISDVEYFGHFISRVICLILIPISVYLSSYYVHIKLLPLSGSGDSFMTPEFQSTLIGNSMNSTPLDVPYGSYIRMLNKDEKIFLHSHTHKYPVHHLIDNKVSSGMQQITGYSHADGNNIWQIERAPQEIIDVLKQSHSDKFNNLNMTVDQEDLIIGDEAFVRLRHNATNSYLMTHDVASALTKTNMEMTALDAANATEISDQTLKTVWKIKFAKKEPILKTKNIFFFIQNVQMGVYVCNHMSSYPEWGYNQREINGARSTSSNCEWNVIDMIDENGQIIEIKPSNNSTTKKDMSFFAKFIDIQKAQFSTNSKLIDQHPFKSTASSWPLVRRGIAMWDSTLHNNLPENQKSSSESNTSNDSKSSNQRKKIYLLGNFVSWYSGFLSVILSIIIIAKNAFMEKRGKISSRTPEDHRFAYQNALFIIGFALNYLPFFGMGRSLYLHHYLPAAMLSMVTVGFFLDYLLKRAKTKVAIQFLCFILILFSVYIFAMLAPITFGIEISESALKARKLFKTWDFI